MAYNFWYIRKNIEINIISGSQLLDKDFELKFIKEGDKILV